jgi:hypothetical protein
MFSKRHYEAIACAMQNAHPAEPCVEAMWTQWDMTRQHLAEAFRRDNPRFDTVRFTRACEPGADVRVRS